ncbi:hypothetical protein Angca_010000 [Angiostrongylus cantonensis]|nr:hypothetical protein Angca_010000 [Angiostrongylus cantonensis]
MCGSTNPEKQLVEDVMIPTEKRHIPLPSFIGNLDKLLFCQQNCVDGPPVYALAVDSEVTLSLGTGRLLQRHSVPFSIRQLLWVVFPPSKSEIETACTQEFFCLVGIRDLMFIAVNDSHPLGYRLQFDIHAVHVTKFGLLVERDISSRDTSSTQEQVALYSLSHPLNELLAVIFKPRDSLTEWLFCWQKYRYSIVGAEKDCLLVFDHSNEMHCLLRIRITSEYEVRSAIELLEKRRVEVSSTQGTPLFHLESTPISAQRLQGSGASINTGRMHTGSGTVGSGPLIRSVHTRSMTARMARTRSFPHPPHAPPSDSPALSIFSPMSLGQHSEAANTTASQLCDPVHQIITPKMQVFSRELQRQPDFDLLLAELCLDHIWAEPSKRDASGEIASKMFLSHNVLLQDFLNFFLGAVGQLRSIRVVRTVGNITTSGTLGFVPCRDAVGIRNGDLTVVLEMDNSIGLYSGQIKCAVAVIPRFTISPSMLLISADNLSFVVQYGSQLTKIKVPSLFDNSLARDVLTAVVDVLPREKAMHLMLDWRVRSRNYGNDLDTAVSERQLHSVLRFLLKQCGVSIGHHDKLPWRKIQHKGDDSEVDAKQRRPKASAEKNLNRLLSFGEGILQKRAKKDIRPGNSVSDVTVTIDSTAILYGQAYAVIGAIHCVFEEWSLDCGLFHVKSEVVYYLHAAASVFGLTSYCSQYSTEFPDCADYVYHIQRFDGLEIDVLPSPIGHLTRNFSVDYPFSLWRTVAEILQPHLTHSLTGSSSKVARLLTVLSVGLGTGRLALMIDVHRLLGRNWERRLRLDAGQVDKVAEIMFNRTRTPAQKSVALISEFGFTRWTIEQLPSSIGLLLGSIIVGQHTSTELFQFKRPQTFSSFPQPDEMAQIARIRWPRDVRRDNVRAMLDSTKPVLIATQHLDAGTDGEIREAQEQFLLATWTRYLSQAFGRAFFSFRTVLPNPAEALTVPDLCLSARIYPSNLTYDLTLTEHLKHLREWGEFYNGVSAGLSIVGADVARVDHEWLTLCHTNEKISPPTAAGLIYAFGMNGHLPNFNMFHIHEVLASLDKFPSIALLLGMAMSKLGTGDRQVHKMLTTHLPFLMGPTMLNLKIDPLIQTSAVSGLGLLFAQTGHTNVVNKLLNEIGKSLRADEEPSIELSAYKLSAGFAIGLICLGLGEELFVWNFNVLISHCVNYPNFQNRCVFIQPQLLTCSDVQTTTMTSQENRSNHVREGTNVNVHMTAHPATIALGLMYMRTGNLEIARDLELPATISLLEEIRPDVIFVRVVARSLVLWNMIEPTCAWIDKQIPNIIHEYARAVLKFPSNIEINVTDKEQAYWDEVVDKETVAEVYLYAMTAACFVMTLKFSGIVGDMYEDILKILEDRMQFLMHDFNIESIEWPARHIIRAANRSVVNLCADMMLLSMAILNVGRGKVNTIRFARYRRSHDCELSYWSHYLWKYNEEMSVHRSLAMLFLGDGRYGFKKDNLSIALLVISMYPIVAHHVADNRLYHQPLRFLWTHAVEPRLLVPMCRKKNKPIQCDLEIQFKDPSLRACSFSAPTILPPIDELALIELSGAGIEKVRFDLTYEGRKRDLVEILTTGHGRVPITVTESCLDDNELAQQKDWTLRQIFDHRVDRPSGKVVKFAREYERMKMSRHPGGAGDLRWQSIDTVPAIRQYLRTLHMEITACPPSLAPFVVNDVKLASCVAKFIGNTPLANRLDIEAQRLEHAAKL